jgi:hypothetical protein
MKKINKIIFMALLINFSQTFAKDNNLEIINNTPDNLFIYTQYTNWKIASDIAENVLVAIINVFELSMNVPQFTPFVKIGGGNLFYLEKGKTYKSSSIKDIHKLLIRKSKEEDKPDKKIKKKNFDVKLETFAIKNKDKLQNKIDVKIGKTTKVYIEPENNNYRVWSTQPK